VADARGLGAPVGNLIAIMRLIPPLCGLYPDQVWSVLRLWDPWHHALSRATEPWDTVQMSPRALSMDARNFWLKSLWPKFSAVASEGK